MRNCKVLGTLCDLNLFERFLRHTLHFPTYIVYVIKVEREYKRFRAFRSGRAYEHDVAGNDALMMASIFGRTDNVKFWLKQYPDWDLER